MKIIAVVKEIPIFSTTKELRKYIINEDLKFKLLGTPLKNKGSNLMPILDKKTYKANSEPEFILLHKKFHQSFMRDLRDVTFIGILSNISIKFNEETGSEDLVNNLKKDYAKNGFYPIEENELIRLSKRFSDMHIKNVCLMTKCNDLLINIDEDRSFGDYKAGNRLMCDNILKIYEKGDIIWILDHLFWHLPSIIRETVPDARICTTLSLPFPSGSIFERISNSFEITESLLCSSCIEFQSKKSLNNFLEFCKLTKKNVTYDEASNFLCIDSKQTKCVLNKYKACNTVNKMILSTKKCKKYIKKIKERYKNQKIVVSISSVSSTNELLNVYKAIEHFFENYDSNVIFINIEILDGLYDPEVKAEIGRIEEYIRIKYGSNRFKRKVDIKDYKYYGILRSAYMGLFLCENSEIFLPVIDFILSQPKKRPALILASKNLEFFNKDQVCKVNPRDFYVVADKINEILNSSNIRKHSIDMLSNVVCSYRENVWFKNFEKNMKFTRFISESLVKTDVSSIIEEYKKASRKLFLLDYDGTLTKIVENKDDARPTEELVMLLDTLNKKNHVIVITGRDKSTIDGWIKNPEIEIYAEHGILNRKNGTWQSISNKSDWKPSAIEIMNFYVERTPEAFLEVKETSICFHYRKCSVLIREKQAQCCKNSLYLLFKDFKNLEVNEGKCIVEIRESGVNKGDIAKKLVSNYDFVLCAGDDNTDESMFSKCCNESNFYSVSIGRKKTTAKFYLEDSDSFVSLLKQLSI